MNDERRRLRARQRYALTHVANDMHGVLNSRLHEVRRHPGGFLVQSILAVDR